MSDFVLGSAITICKYINEKLQKTFKKLKKKQKTNCKKWLKTFTTDICVDEMHKGRKLFLK